MRADRGRRRVPRARSLLADRIEARRRSRHFAVPLRSCRPCGRLRLLADQLDAAGDAAGADQARARFIRPRRTIPVAAGRGCSRRERSPGRPGAPRRSPAALSHSISALRMQAEVAAGCSTSPDHLRTPRTLSRPRAGLRCRAHNYASPAESNDRPGGCGALKQIEQLLAKAPRDPGYRRSAGPPSFQTSAGFDETVESTKSFSRSTLARRRSGELCTTRYEPRDGRMTAFRLIVARSQWSDSWAKPTGALPT